MSTAMSPQPVIAVHGALILANIIFGFGSIIGALGLPAANPLAFTTIREVIAGCLLLGISFVSTRKPPTYLKDETRNNSDDNHHHNQESIQDYLFPRSWHHFEKFCILGFFLFCNQSCYIVGIQLAGPVTASIWQPSAPSFTAALAMLWKLEPWSVRRLSGVLVAFGGCAAMVLLTNRSDDNVHGGTVPFFIGNLLFFVNCSSTACYILLSKELLQLRYPSWTVVGMSYLLASTGMFVVTLLSVYLPVGWICTTCSRTPHGAFCIPREALPALAYYTLAMSVGGWGLIIWSNQFASGTLVMGYSVLQPVTSLIFTVLLLLGGLVVQCGRGDNESSTSMDENKWCLNEPGIGTLCGMAGVFCGLSLIIKTEPTTGQAFDENNIDSLTEYGTLVASSSSS